VNQGYSGARVSENGWQSWVFEMLPPSQGNLPAASRGLRGRTPCQSNSLEPEHPLLAPTRRSVDQQATGRERTGPGVNVYPGRLSGSPGVTSFLKVTGCSSLVTRSALNLCCDMNSARCFGECCPTQPSTWPATANS
jgi:hypothetical protein